MLIVIDKYNQVPQGNAYACLDIMIIHQIICVLIAIILGENLIFLKITSSKKAGDFFSCEGSNIN